MASASHPQPIPPDPHRPALTSTASRIPSGQTPPYWNRHERSFSSASYVSIAASRPPPIVLEDHTEDQPDASRGLWAKGVKISDYVVVSGGTIGATVGAGSYVVWNCTVETLDGGPLHIRKRYSEFDRLRSRLVMTFPHSAAAMPLLPPKSVVSRFRLRFLEKRREGLEYFMNCILLNPEFASSPVLKEFIFS